MITYFEFSRVLLGIFQSYKWKMIKVRWIQIFIVVISNVYEFFFLRLKLFNYPFWYQL